MVCRAASETPLSQAVTFKESLKACVEFQWVKSDLNVWGKRGEQMDGPAILSESDHERLVGSVGDRKSQRAWKVLDPKDTRALRVGMTCPKLMSLKSRRQLKVAFGKSLPSF